MDTNCFVRFCLIIVCCCCFLRMTAGMVIIPGDVTIVGMFSIHEPNDNKCSARVDINSVKVVEAVKWYIQNLNEQGGLDFKIGFEVYDTCRSKLNAGQIGIQVINRALEGDTIIGVLGPEHSSEAETVSSILSNVNDDYQMAVVGFSSTATRLNDDKYPNYIRVIPNDDIQIEMMLKTMEKLEWNRIAILYEDDIYGIAATERLKSKALDDSICISSSHRLSVVNGVNVEAVQHVLWDILLGKGSRPAVNGIVFIVGSETAKTLFHLIESLALDISTLPIIMLSEGFGLDESVFYKSGSVLDAAKGLYAVLPPYIEVTEFTEHWNSIFSSSKNFNQQVETNPWLHDVYDTISDCGQGNCAFIPRTEPQLLADFGDKSLFIQYAILGAHALTKSADIVRQSLCQEGNCSAFYDQYLPKHVLSALKGMDLIMDTDLKWSVASLNDIEAVIDISGEISLPDDTTHYELYNFQATIDDGTDFELVKVGNLLHGQVEINFQDIRDYSLGQPTTWPNVRKAQCLPTKTCSECIPLEALQEAVFFEDGDIFVVGVVPVFQKVGIKDCGEIRSNDGYQMLESIRFAIHTVNSGIGEYATYFPGKKIGLAVLNSCNSPVVVQRKIFDLDHSGVTLQNGTTVDLRNRIIGYIAEYTSTLSISIAEVLSRLGFVQIATSTSPALSNRELYPYFMRVVSPDDAQAKLMVEMMVKLNVTYAQIVYNTGAYGEAGQEKVIENAKARGICIKQSIPLEEDENVYSVYERLRKYAHARVVLLFLYPNVLVRLTEALIEKMQKGEFVFIGSETWAQTPAILQADTKGILLGSFTIALEMYQDRSLKTHVQALTPQPFSENPWVTMYLQQKFNCYFSQSFDKSQPKQCTPEDDFGPDFLLDTYDTTVFVQSLSLLAGANAFLQRTCGSDGKGLCKDFTDNPKGLVEEILKIKMDLDGSGDRIKVFDSNSDGNMGYRIYNVQKDEINPQKLTYSRIGRYPLEGTFTFELDQIVYPTNTKLVSQCPNALACKDCIQRRPTSPSSDVTSTETKSDIGELTLGVLLAAAVIIVFILSIMYYRLYRKTAGPGTDLYLTPAEIDTGKLHNFAREASYIEPLSSFDEETRYI